GLQARTIQSRFESKSACKGTPLQVNGSVRPRSSGREHQGGIMIRWLVGAIGLSLVAAHAVAADPIEVGIGYLAQARHKSKLSLVEKPAHNDGIAGARPAIEDNNTTGKFLNQRFLLQEVRLGEGDDPAKAAAELAGRNGFIIADLPADALLKVADALRDR